MDQRDFEVFFTSSEWIPNLLQEIGRLREISFREVGEGTDQEIDLDRYDVFYRHLILWDNHKRKIAAANQNRFWGGNHFSTWDRWVLYRQPIPY